MNDLERMEAAFAERATDAVKTRRTAKKMTMEKCMEWIVSVVQKKNTECVTRISSTCSMATDEFVFDEMIHYFADCDEGDTYLTRDELDEKQDHLDEQKRNRDRVLRNKREQHRARVARWASMTRDQIEVEIYIKRNPTAFGCKTIEDIRSHRAEMEARKAVREAEEAKRKRKYEAKKAREAEAVRKQKIAAEMESAQMTFEF